MASYPIARMEIIVVMQLTIYYLARAVKSNVYISFLEANIWTLRSGYVKFSFLLRQIEGI